MTVGSPTQHSQQAVNDRMAQAEQIINLTGYNNPIGQYGSITFGIATVTMPWAGVLTAHVVHQGNYPPGLMHVTLWLNPSSPAPVAFYAGTCANFQDVGTSYDFVAGQAQWHDLAKGQAVTINARVENNLSNVNWTCMAFTGWLRMTRV